MMIAQQERGDGRPDAASLDVDHRGSVIDASCANLLSSPLEFLYAEHLRQRQFARLLTLIADGVINRKTIKEAIAFIEADLAHHILDEELSLFPLLRRACPADDRIDELLALLSEDHRQDEGGSEAVLIVLRRMAGGESAQARDEAVLRDFADHLRRHLALENGVLLPLAESRMTPDLLRILSQSMTARRNKTRM